MVVNLLHPGNVLRTDAEAERTPVVFRQCVDDAVANMVVVGGRIGDLAGKAGDRLQQVGARYDPDDLLAPRHRQTLDVVLLHQLHDLLERRIFGDGERLLGHDFGDLAAVFVNEIGCRLARAENEFQPSATLALRADLAAADEIPLRDDADEFAGGVGYRKPADVALQHDVCGFDDRGLGRNGDDGPRHDLVGAHWRSPRVRY